MKTLIPLFLLLMSCATRTAYTPVSGEQINLTLPDAAPEVVDPALPNVLLIGDSISIGYMLKVRANLQGKANVYHNLENSQGTRYALENGNLDKWLAVAHWDVIHFNFGLWDLAHKQFDKPETFIPGKGFASDTNGGFVTSSPWQYQVNLKTIIGKLKATGAKLIFATTTPIPPQGSGGRFAHSEELYNQFALDVMQAESIPTDDLYTQFSPASEQHRASPGNVHFDETGYNILAGFVTNSIQGAL